MKKRMSKRFLSMLLVVVMALSTLPMSALAAEANFSLDNIEVKSEAVDPNGYVSGDMKMVLGIDMTSATVSGTTVTGAEGLVELYLPRATLMNYIISAVEAKVPGTVYEGYYNSWVKEFGQEQTVKIIYTALYDRSLDDDLAALYAASTTDELLAAMNGINASLSAKFAPYVGVVETIVGESGEIVVRVLGDDDETGLNKLSAMGFYFIVGANLSGGTPDFKPVVLANKVDVAISINGGDKGVAAQVTHGDPLNVSVEVTDGDQVISTGDNVKIMYVGVDTSGDGWCRTDAPKDPGAYMVVALYLDRNNMTLGADACALAIMPQEVEFQLAATTEKTYEEGTQHFAEFTEGGDLQYISVAANGNEIWVNYPEGLTNYINNASDRVYSYINSIPTIPSDTLDAVLDCAANALDAALNKVNAFDGVGDVSGSTLKAEFNQYASKAQAYEITDEVMDVAEGAVEKVEKIVAESDDLEALVTMIGAALSDANIEGLDDIDYDVVAAKLVKAMAAEMNLTEATAVTKLAEIQAKIGSYGYDEQAIAALKTLAALGNVQSVDGVTLGEVMDNVTVKAKAMVATVLNELGGENPDVRGAVKAVETFVDDVLLATAMDIVDEIPDDLVINVGTNPTEIGTYNCYAVNLSTKQMPTPTTGTLIIAAAEEPALKLTAMEVSFDAEILLWTYFAIPDELLNDDNAKVLVTMDYAWDGQKTTEIPMAELREQGPTSYGDYKVEQGVASGEMIRDVTVQFVDGDGNYVNIEDYVDGSVDTKVVRTVADYATRVFEVGTPKQQELVKAMLTYGGYSQKHFGVDAEHPVYDLLCEYGYEIPTLADITADSITQEIKKSASGNGLTYSAQEAYLDFSIYHRVYFKLDVGQDINNFKFEAKMIDVHGVQYTKTLAAEYDSEYDEYYVDILDIPAAYLDHMYTVTATNLETSETYEVTTSVLVWAKLVMQTSEDANHVNLAKAVYHYNQAANEFFGK